MVRRRAWMTLVLTPFACGWAIMACGITNTMPPLLNEPIEAGMGGGGGGGGGGEGGGATACFRNGGTCTLAGNLDEGGSGGSGCPVYLQGVSCGPGSTTEAGTLVLVCCTGYNDAGSPIFDTGLQ